MERPGCRWRSTRRKNVVITASTAELRRWLVTHADDEGLFDAPTILRRKVAAEAATPR